MITVVSTSGDSSPPTTNVRRSALTKHGTERGWRVCSQGENGGRCEACRNAKQAAWKRQLESRLDKPIPEGATHGEYIHRHYGCDCEICIADTRTKKRERKRRERARKEANS